MRTIERKRFRLQRQEEDADEGAVMIAHDSSVSSVRSDKIGQTEWSCDPCGSLNTVDRLNCAYCGKVRP